MKLTRKKKVRKKKRGDDPMELIYLDEDIVVCIKPERVLSTDEPGGLPDLIREAFRIPVHLTINEEIP